MADGSNYEAERGRGRVIETFKPSVLRLGCFSDVGLLTDPNLNGDRVYLPNSLNINEAPMIAIFRTLGPDEHNVVSKTVINTLEKLETGRLADVSGNFLKKAEVGTKVLLNTL